MRKPGEVFRFLVATIGAAVLLAAATASNTTAANATAASAPAENAGADAGRPSQRIVVIGGSGMIGQRIVREALNRGHEVTLVARDPAKVTDEHDRLKVMQGDVLDPDSLRGIFAGQNAVVSAVGAARAQEPDYLLYLRAADSLVAALRAMDDGAPRLLVVGGFGSLLDSSGKLAFERAPRDRRPEHLGQKAALDFYRTVDDVRWTYLSPPGRIAPGERKGQYRTGEDRLLFDDQGGVGAISMEDYAVAMIDEIEQPRYVGRRFTVAY